MKNVNRKVCAHQPPFKWPLNACAVAVFACLFGLGITAHAQTQYRTITDKELASIYQSPDGTPWTDYGYFDGSPATLAPDAQRVFMSNFLQFYPGEDSVARTLPYAQLRQYEAQQIAAGQPPIFATAYYEGQHRPVLFAWSLGLVDNKPTLASSEWQYVVNVQDTRFIHFWINHYVQPLLAKYQVWESFGPDIWFHLDQGSWQYSLYGVLDDNNNFVSGVTWDAPAPQNQAEFEAAIETFFSQIKSLAPNVNVIVNLGEQVNPSHFPQLFANVGGAMTENLYSWFASPTAYSRNLWYTQDFQYFTWMASQNRVTTLRTEIPPSASNGLLDSFILYSLLKGQNSFFAPSNTSGDTTPPSEWAGMAAQLGKPTGSMVASAATSAGTGYRLFSRTFQGGIAYLNATGTTQTIPLPSGVAYYGPGGNQVTSIVLADNTASYVTTSPNALPEPQISPRYAAPAQGPVSVTLSTATTGATIRYTLDGSTPTSFSPEYSGPISVSKSEVVSARAFYGSQSSLTNTASYTISTSPVTAEFLLTSDSSMSGTYYPVVKLSAIPNTTVEVYYSVLNGTPASGSYKFLPGMLYGILPITTGSSGITTITLTSASGAELGPNTTLEYTIH